MKTNAYFIYPILTLLFFSSCKKDQPLPEQVKPEATIPILSNSSSFTINGKTYTGTNVSSLGVGNYGTNLKIDTSKANTINTGDWSTFSGGKYWTGAKDSLQYFRTFSLPIDGDLGGRITFSFIHNYPKNVLTKEYSMFYPANDIQQLFSTGDYNYAVDFQRESKQNGIAIEKYSHESGSLSSYIPVQIAQKSTLNSTIQAGSKFKITKFEKQIDGMYLLEATFEAILFDKEEKPVKIENGFVRLRLSGNPRFIL